MFSYLNNLLHAENIPLTQIAARFNTPSYIYSRNIIESNWKQFDNAFKHKHLICYSVKANSNIAILNLLAKLGSGFDIVSTGELRRIIYAGGDPKKVVFSGVGKSKDEIDFALKHNIKCFNIESKEELFRLQNIATNLKLTAPVSFRINPDIDAKTHPYISTGLKENKFGIAIENAISIYKEASAMKSIDVVGIDCHIGSQIMELSPFIDTLNRIVALTNELKKYNIKLKHIDIGGGLGINYDDEQPPSIQNYAIAISKIIQNSELEIIIEPGRSIVGNAGLLLTKVEYIKTTSSHNFAIVDSGMNDLMRPSLYDAWHLIKPVIKKTNVKKLKYDVVGPVCETADFLGKDRLLGKLEENDLLAIYSAGAYGFSMASNYNSRARAAEIMVDNEKVFEIRKREKIEDLIKGESTLP